MASRRDEVQASMYSSIMEGDQVSLDLELLSEVVLELLVDVLHNGAAAVLLVNLVAKPCRAHHCQPQLHIALFQIYRTMKTQERWLSANKTARNKILSWSPVVSI